MTDPLGGYVTADGEAGGAVGLVALDDAVAPGDGHVVYDPLLHVVLVDTLVEEVHLLLVRLLLFRVLLLAEDLAAIHCLSKLNLKTKGTSNEKKVVELEILHTL